MSRERFMRRAAELARQAFGLTAPNPCVGAVLVRDGRVVAEGYHKVCGGPHAEREAIADAKAEGVDPAECDLYVTLEPCNHHGRTPPCTEAILEASIPRVFVGCLDPNRSVEGGGVERLRREGVEVVTGLCERQCLDLIADFSIWQKTRRTCNILKMAMTLDGRIAGRDGRPAAVSGEASGRAVQHLRSRVDAVVVGGSTFSADDPRLDCRLEGAAKDPLAVVVTSRPPKPDADMYLLRERPGKTVFWTTAEAEARSGALRELGCRVWALPQRADGDLDLEAGFNRLREELGAHHVMCEGGGRLAMSMVAQRLVDELLLFVAPRVLGDEKARSVFAGRGPAGFAETFDFRVADVAMSGEDVRFSLRPREEE